MCGRYTLVTDVSGMNEWVIFRAGGLIVAPRYNIAPTQQVLVVTNYGDRAAEFMRWGLIPFWAKDAKIGSRMINARSETVATSGAFRRPFANQRCLVIADGFYEWYKEGKQRTPMRIVLKSREPFAFAGLWDSWKNPDGETIRSCTIITTIPNALIEPIHDRMPVILPREAEARWLEDGTSSDALQKLLIPYSAYDMEAYPVPDIVNKATNDVPECIQPRL